MLSNSLVVGESTRVVDSSSENPRSTESDSNLSALG